MESDLLRRYFKGQVTADEAARVRGWLSADEALPQAAANEGQGDTAARRERLWAAISPETPFLMDELLSPPRRRAGPRTGLRRAALVAAGLALCGLVATTGLFLHHSDPFARWTEDRREHRILKTANGQKAVLTLADGSVIRLNGGSTIRYPADFSHGPRTVRLEGEAFFEVAPDENRPFTVTTPRTRTRVLGTAFNLRAYPGDATTTLAVQHGLVSFAGLDEHGSQETEARVGASQAARFAGAPGGIERLAGDAAAPLLAWKDGVLGFENRALADIAPDLERWYGVKVEIRSGEAARQRFTGRYEHPVLRDLARDITLATGVRHRLGAHALTFY